jgi:hypothetical protein
VHNHAHEAQHCAKQSNRFKNVLPNREAERNARFRGQVAVALGLGGIVQHVNHVRSANRVGIVNPGVLKTGDLAQLRSAIFRYKLHVFFGPEVQAPGGTCLDAGGLQASSHSVRAERALVNLFRVGVEFRNIEGAARDTELAANAVFLLEIDDAVGVLHDGAIGRTGPQASGIFAVHALVLAHEPCKAAIVVLVLVELNEVPVIPVGVGHRLVGVVEVGLLERHVVPFHAGHFAGFAADAGGGVDQLAHLVLALRAFAGYRSRMGRDLLDS